ncbi:MAG TPA: hypothetical protein VK186_06365 [Candidatus Deferrimicrobium sp.]|nr:hypothetical protein [Candidatus Deferrimicrobium sp.]
MKKYFTVLFFFMVWTFYQQHYFIYGQTKTAAGDKPGYRLEYTVQGQTTGVILFIFRYRFFFLASASVLLEPQQIDEKTLQFNYQGIDKTGYFLCTRGFSGRWFCSGAADYETLSDQQIMETGVMKFKKAAPDYYKFIKYQKPFPFKILSRGEKTLTFKREISGVHKDFSNEMQVESAKYQPNFYFKIYSILMDMIKLYNHDCLPGDVQKISALKPGMTWESPNLDFTGSFNRVGAQLARAVEEMVTFKQKSPFKVKYRVVSRTPQKLTVLGEAVPRVEIFGSYKIDNVTRLIELRLPDGVVLQDKYRIEIWKTAGKGGFAEVALTLVR